MARWAVRQRQPSVTQVKKAVVTCNRLGHLEMLSAGVLASSLLLVASEDACQVLPIVEHVWNYF